MACGKTYRPSKFTIGYRDGETEAGEKIKRGYPSCKWLREGKWTELGRFSSHTGGYKPHPQRDEEKQLKKDLGLQLEELDNELISGFQLIEAHHGYASNDHYIRVKDPRGFTLDLDARFVEDVLLKWHLGISGNGMIEGKWFYFWTDGSFSGIKPESELANVQVDDSVLDSQEKMLKSYTIEDLVVGTVYDMASAKGDKSEVERVVYLGQKMLPNLPTIRNFFCNGFQLSKLGRNWERTLRYGLDSKSAKELEFLPWYYESDVKKAENVMKPWKLTPVFILLDDEFSSYKLEEYVYYCDDLAGIPQEEKEHSIKFCIDQHYDRSSLLAGRDIVKRLVNESKFQDLRIVRKDPPWARKSSSSFNKQFAYQSAKEYKVMKLETLDVGLDRYLQKLKKRIDDQLELAPAKMPDDLKEWIHKVGEWYRRDYEPKNRQTNHWW